MRLIPELPLLRRELIELANRKRTYVIRVVGAIAILLCVLVYYGKAIAERQSTGGFGLFSGITRYLGVVGDIFSDVTPILFYAIQLLMPALCCACITGEKEANTIGTLFLTRLTPSTIILEKLGSRLTPMLTLLLLTFPVLAYVYTLGGVDTDLLIGTLWLLFCECLLIASIAILCSSWFSSTVAAFIWSYVAIGIMVALSMSLGISTFMPSAIWNGSFQDVQDWGISRAQLQVLTSMGMAPAAGDTFTWMTLVFRSLPSLFFTAIFLLFARLFLTRRAFVSHSSVLLKIFRSVDSFFKQLNERTTGGIEIVKDSSPLPDKDPVAWRERNKKSLGKARYLFRILVFLELPTFFICMLAAISSARSSFEGLYVLQALIWTLAVLVIAVKGATLFSSERSRQTIEPLLATPMTSIEILSQKIAGMRRLIIVMAVPILTVNLTHALVQQRNWTQPLIYLILSSFAAFTLLYLVTWVSAGIGLKIHSQTKSVLVSAIVLLGWALTPIEVCAFLPVDIFISKMIMLASPISAVANIESFIVPWESYEGYGYYRQPVDNTPPIIWSLMALFIYSAMVVLISLTVRNLCGSLLNRRESSATRPVRFDPNTSPTPAMEGSHS